MLQVQANVAATTVTPLQITQCPHSEIPPRFLQRVWNGTNGYIREFECPRCQQLIWDE